MGSLSCSDSGVVERENIGATSLDGRGQARCGGGSMGIFSQRESTEDHPDGCPGSLLRLGRAFYSGLAEHNLEVHVFLPTTSVQVWVFWETGRGG